MILGPNELYSIKRILENNFSFFIGSTMGPDFLSKEDKRNLKSIGVDVSKVYSPSSDFILNNFHLGALSEFVGEHGAKNATFKDLQEYMKSGKFFPLTQKELRIIDSIKMQSLKDIRSTQGRIFSDINGLISKENYNQRGAYEEIIRDVHKEGLENRKSAKKILSDLGKITGDYSRDFSKSVAYISHTALQEGKTAAIEKKFGKDANVYKEVYKDACKHCKRLYLKKDGTPKIFKLSELVGNGTNIGRKQNDWLPVVGATHIHCRCNLREAEEQEELNIDRPKVEVTFNGKTYVV